MNLNTLPDASVAAILPAAGQSTRFAGSQKKVFAPLGGKPVWQHAVETLRRRSEVGPIVVAISADDQNRWDTEYASAVAHLKVTLVDGGNQRYDSVRNAIESSGQTDYVAIHDAARPLVSHRDLDSLFSTATSCDACMLAARIRGTIKRADAHQDVACTVDRSGLWEALTPQLFRRDILLSAQDRWRGWPITDDASLLERAGKRVRLVPGSPLNIKITEPEDLALAEAILASQSGAASET